MPIYIPGYRSKNKRRHNKVSSKRNVVAALQLTAMVDMFTVLVVFLLQNYASTNQVLPISDQLALPKATVVKELKPSFVVILSKDYLFFNNKKVASFNTVKSDSDWLIESLLNPVKEVIKNKSNNKTSKNKPFKYKITLQADKNIDFLSIKKVLYTLTIAGVQEINFAVIKIAKNKDKYSML